MVNVYTSYKCKECKREFIVLTEEIQSAIRSEEYLACPYCNSKRVVVDNFGDTLVSLMNDRKYRRDHGVIKQY